LKFLQKLIVFLNLTCTTVLGQVTQTDSTYTGANQMRTVINFSLLVVIIIVLIIGIMILLILRRARKARPT
jgi:heme/copper-type cytochrome/quinol oxidase subunit 2